MEFTVSAKRAVNLDERKLVVRWGLGGKDQPVGPAAPPCALSQSAKVVPSANFHAVRPLMLAPTTIAAAAVTDLKM